MTEAWKTWEGQSVDGFLLRQYLGGSDHSAVYLTQLHTTPPQDAAIKFTPADAAADAQIARWSFAGALKHANLIQLIRVGRCQVANASFLYVVMEYAEENLSQILPARALEPEEARQILESVLDALSYLHGQGRAHTRIKPGNILASSDQLKISSDTLCEIGSAPQVRPQSTIYDSPESVAAPVSAASDIWSLGVTVVEALTQRTPVVKSQTRTELPVPETIPPPFLEIARRSLQTDPARRATLRDIWGLLNPGPAPRLETRAGDAHQLTSGSAVAHAALSGSGAGAVASVETSKKSLAAQRVSVAPHTLISAAATPAITEPAPGKSRYALPIIVVLLVLTAGLFAPRVLNRFSQLQPHADTVQPTIAPASELLDPPAAVAKRQQDIAKVAAAPAPATPPPASAVKPGNLAAPATSAPLTVAPSPKSAASSKATRALADNAARGAVLYQVVPEVSARARETILGTVRAIVKVRVDPGGNVIAADLENGSNRFFGDQAVESARRWIFTPPQVDGRNAPSEWTLRFEFSPTVTKVFPTQTAP